MEREKILEHLYEKHHNQVQAFYSQQEEALQGAAQKEQEILRRNNCNRLTASYAVWEELEALWRTYDFYWSNNGKFITELLRRQQKQVADTIKEIQQRQNRNL